MKNALNIKSRSYFPLHYCNVRFQKNLFLVTNDCFLCSLPKNIDYGSFNMFFYCRSFLKGPVDHRTKVTLLLTTFHSRQLLVNVCCLHLRQHHSIATLRMVCVPGLRTGLTGLIGQDTGVLLVAFSLVLALIIHQAHVSITFEMCRWY